jgi:general nucleoside transport system ATP-binding protein
MPRTVLRLANITKRFGALVANDAVNLALCEGELLALLGENGAGKTTLVNILFGHYTADAGKVEAFGRELAPGRPRAAIDAGIGMVHQHFTLAANLSVLDNVMIGTEPLYRARSRRAPARRRLADLSARFGLAVDPDARVGGLSVGERQRVEILKSLCRDARILVLDEPTAVLTPQESGRLLATLRAMTREGLSVILISHKLDEVLAAADRIVILRSGRVVAERRASGTDRAELAELMVGRRVVRPDREPLPAGEVVLEARDVGLDEGRRRLLDRASFALRAHEIVGIAGVAGNGQAALMRLLAGLAVPTAGRLTLLGRPLARADPRSLVRCGVARIPEDRLAQGVVADMTLWENAVLERVGDAPFSRFGVLRREAAVAHARDLLQRFDVRGGDAFSRARLLSGGNMQKLILGRNLVGAPRLVVASQPTRGLDEGAIAEMHRRLLEARSAGAGIVLISEDLDEILALADRIHVIASGRLSASLAAADAHPARLGMMMAGHFSAATADDDALRAS